MTTVTLPGLSAVAERAAAPLEPLRTDVAVFVGRTRRGPVATAQQVSGWREFRSRYGGLDADSSTSYAVRAYFDNGGEVAWVLRLEGAAATEATGTWTVGSLTDEGAWDAQSPASGGFAAVAYRVTATSPGTWANDTRVTLRYRAVGVDGGPEVDARIVVPGEAPEVFSRIPPRDVAAALERSGHVRLEPLGDPVGDDAAGGPGPTAVTWEVTLVDGNDDVPSAAQYLAACDTVAALAEPALVVAPDLYADIPEGRQRCDVIACLAVDAAESLDRLVLLDVPPERAAAQDAVGWLAEILDRLGDQASRRAAAVYHPRLSVLDPLGGTVTPIRTIPPAGAVAGVVSRLDRERGAHHTPANATVYDTVDVADLFTEAEELLLHGAGINLLRCSPSRGVQVWGGRTLDQERPGTFVAHRRLIHRLVRAIHRVTQPLVFDTNGPELWLTLVRSITTVLLEAFRSGALKGAQPDEAFRVQCDDELNPPEQRELGQVLCRIAVAPAAPMEFIVVRLSFGLQGELEVVEA